MDKIFDMSNIHVRGLAVNTLKNGLEEEHDKMIPAKPILEHLISKSEEDNTFSERVLLEGKKTQECIKYVLQEVKKKLENKNGYLPREEVFAIAEEYYTLNEVVIDKPKERIQATPKVKDNVKVQVKVEKPEKEQITLFEM